MSVFTTPTEVAVKICNLRAKNRREKPSVNREWGLWIDTLDVPMGARVLVLGPRGGGKGALIDCIDRKEQGIEIAERLKIKRVNHPAELSDCSKVECLLVLSEGHKMSEQEQILSMCPEGSTLLASVDRDQIVSSAVLESFSHLILMVDGMPSFFGTKHDFLHELPRLLREDQSLLRDFPEIKNLGVTQQ